MKNRIFSCRIDINQSTKTDTPFIYLRARKEAQIRNFYEETVKGL